MVSVPSMVAPSGRPRLLRNGEDAFACILSHIGRAQRSIAIRCFDWHDDDAGRLVARSLLAAADRGVRVEIKKDRVGANYEYLEGSQQSLLHKRMTPLAVIQTLFLMVVYQRWGSLRQRPSPLADALFDHPNVRIEAERLRFDHSKLYVFDEATIILGGMGIGDDFHQKNVDFMVEVEDAEAVRRFQARASGQERFDPTRTLDFLTMERGSPDPELLEVRLSLIASATERLTVEMAYLGDDRCTDALVAAVDRGVRVTLLTSSYANIIGDLNLGTCDRILRRTGAPERLAIYLHPGMVHGKAMVVDGKVVQIGSSNFTPLSHAAYGEVDIVSRDPELARAVESAIERQIGEARRVGPRVPYRWPYFYVETGVLAYQSRKASHPEDSPLRHAFARMASTARAVARGQ